MKRILLSGILAVVVGSPLQAQMCPMQPAAEQTCLAVGGRAFATVAPDQASLVLVVEGLDTTRAGASARAERATGRILDTLAALGFRPPAVRVVEYGLTVPSSSEGSSVIATGPRRPGWSVATAQRRTAILIENVPIAELARVTQAALARGVTHVGPPRFRASATDSVRRVLIAKAIDQARADASVAAAAMGVRLGRLIDLSVDAPYPTSNETSPPMLPQRQSYGSQLAPAPEIPVSATVRGRWELLRSP